MAEQNYAAEIVILWLDSRWTNKAALIIAYSECSTSPGAFKICATFLVHRELGQGVYIYFSPLSLRKGPKLRPRFYVNSSAVLTNKLAGR
jgi:hypothetical protein